VHAAARHARARAQPNSVIAYDSGDTTLIGIDSRLRLFYIGNKPGSSRLSRGG